jgi:hypothetical protein
MMPSSSSLVAFGLTRFDESPRRDVAWLDEADSFQADHGPVMVLMTAVAK